MADGQRIKNYIDGEWQASSAENYLEVANPATGEILAKTPLSPPAEVDRAAQAAARAFEEWRRTPAVDRIQHLFKLKELLEENFEDLARTITLENGKTLGESRGEMRRAIENVEVACGIPALMQGEFSEDIARGIDEFVIRQPLGVCSTIAPFNFPGMIAFWFMPYALATGNTYLVKPSERCPLTMQKVMDLLDQAGFPNGVVNLVNGGPETECHPRASSHPGNYLCRLDKGSSPYLCYRSCSWQTRPGSGRREKPVDHSARCRYRDDHPHRRRQRLRERRSALPGCLVSHHCWRSTAHIWRGNCTGC